MENTKICNKCNLDQPISEFYIHPKNGWVFKQCKSCVKKNSKLNMNALRKSNDKEDLLTKSFMALTGHMRAGAKRQSKLFEVRMPELRKLYDSQNGKCFYTSIPMEMTGKIQHNLLQISVDKINPTGGYTIDNIVLCCLGINLLKSIHSPDVLYNTIKLFYEGSKSMGKIL